MAPRLKAVLWGLRIYGPCSVLDLSRHTNRERESVYGAVYQLRTLGLADRLGEASYDITEMGRLALEAPAVEDVAPAESQGVFRFE